MTSMFDSLACERRRRTPWAHMSLLDFAKEVCMRDLDKPAIERSFELRVYYRHDVATGWWYQVSWRGPEGEQFTVSGQSLDLALFRAAEIELQAQARLERREKASSVEQPKGGE